MIICHHLGKVLNHYICIDFDNFLVQDNRGGMFPFLLDIYLLLPSNGKDSSEIFPASSATKDCCLCHFLFIEKVHTPRSLESCLIEVEDPIILKFPYDLPEFLLRFQHKHHHLHFLHAQYHVARNQMHHDGQNQMLSLTTCHYFLHRL